MTVAQLISALQQFPALATVRAYEGEIEGIVVESTSRNPYIEYGIIHNDGHIEVSNDKA